jgi:hypothetical protein
MIDEICEELRGLIRGGAFEMAELRARSALEETPGHPGLTLELSLSLAAQCHFSVALPLAIGVARDERASDQERFTATQYITTCATQLGMPDLARTYIDRLGLSRSGPARQQRLLASLLGHAGLGDGEEALALRMQVRAAHPDDAIARVDLGFARKYLGDSGGEEDYVHNGSREFWTQKEPLKWPDDKPPAGLMEKLWRNQPLDGKRLLIASQGGIGDNLQYARYIPALRRRGAHVIASVPGNLCCGLIESSGADEVRRLIFEDFETCDYWLPTFGLGLPLTPAERIADYPPYLTAPASARVEALVAGVRRRAAGRKCIALVWQSDTDQGPRKSIPTHDILPLFAMPDVHWVILQRGCGLRQLQMTGLTDQCSLAGEDLSFDEAGALLTQIDGLLTIDCYAAHLGGSLGVRTWMLASRNLDPRYLNRERTSVLYPACSTLARQPTIGDWAGAIAIAMADIRAWEPCPNVGLK